ncbi:tRNA-modifying protein YgfZ [Vibrio breoganii]|uniref:tRNA-modifying protein YgfZ n=1 Tax=Vibrio breoganii TaxID=553239 RepID=UPI00080E62A0|nr:tRNA-modifying protein YgfZ [Vibrio breoganii]OCH70735.1 tRNA-modifying protein [Vibrio breoganii]PMG96135.1 tRNA-modifying protein [Vibrio breoganii]PMI22382.1 tRNA-modifying protein [Vibrio breoganii]PMK33290.1 tRNA-modifying protein [Vibrio breoganii]PMK35779.1 tRNA-modifying protein [Vibrio breoganii]
MSATSSVSLHLPSLAWTSLSDWQAIAVTGADSKSYLQGQVTCDVVQLDAERSTLGAHCDAKGKMWSLFRLFHHNQGYALWQHKSGIETALQEIKKYSVFSKVDLELSSQISIGVLGEQADSFIDSITDGQGDVRSIASGSAIKIDSQRWLLLVNEDELESLKPQLQNAEEISADAWDYVDVVNGIPRVIQSQQNTHIPQTLNLQALDGINFEKGCYTGQETVARAKYRGTNKKVMRLLQGTANENAAFTFERQVGENWRGAGEAIAQYRNQQGEALALIVLNKDIEFDTQFRLVEDTTNTWSLVELPYDIEQ